MVQEEKTAPGNYFTLILFVRTTGSTGEHGFKSDQLRCNRVERRETLTRVVPGGSLDLGSRGSRAAAAGVPGADGS
jgi:hypothetical protein